jgi:hypothetical protein
MDDEQLEKVAVNVVRVLIATGLINANNNRRAVGIVKQALESSKFEASSTLSLFFSEKK